MEILQARQIIIKTTHKNNDYHHPQEGDLCFTCKQGINSDHHRFLLEV